MGLSQEPSSDDASELSLAKIINFVPKLVSQIDLLNRTSKAVEQSSDIGIKIVGLPQKVRAAAAALFLSSATVIIWLPAAKSFFVTPLVGSGTAFLVAAVVPASKEDKRRKRIAELQLYIENNYEMLQTALISHDFETAAILRKNIAVATECLHQFITGSEQSLLPDNESSYTLLEKKEGTLSISDKYKNLLTHPEENDT